ncbi:hypothetical protein Q8F55_003622 [Vanrija albida]|uniref:UBA domain-containing protein n=1 Tax=Vanrija albida TaxID=181172 RepID=A0ABR3Q4P6_9TREE
MSAPTEAHAAPVTAASGTSPTAPAPADLPASDAAPPRRNSQDPMWRRVLRRPSLDPAAVDKLVGMGYDRGTVKDTLRRHEGDVDASAKKLAYLHHLRVHWQGRPEAGCEHCQADARAERRPSVA